MAYGQDAEDARNSNRPREPVQLVPAACAWLSRQSSNINMWPIMANVSREQGRKVVVKAKHFHL